MFSARLKKKEREQYTLRRVHSIIIAGGAIAQPAPPSSAANAVTLHNGDPLLLFIQFINSLIPRARRRSAAVRPRNKDGGPNASMSSRATLFAARRLRLA